MEANAVIMTILSRSLLDNAKIGLITLGPDHRIVACEGKLVDWLSQGAEATQAIPFLTGLGGILDDIKQERMSSFSLPRVGWGDSLRSHQVLSLEIIPADVPGHLQIILRDETDVARLERNILQQRNELSLANVALAEAKERAEELLREKASFLASVSHDLKTPLQVIMGNAEILRSDLSREERDRFLQDVWDNSNFLLSMITDLLDASALEADQLALTEEPVEIRSILERVLSTARQIPEGNDRRFALLVEDENQRIMADPMRLRRLLTNLVGNAVKFTEGGGHIDVNAQGTDSGYYLISVKDDGCGIDSKLIDRVFDPFVMGGSSDGSGLGLYIAKGIAELHGAALSIRSEIGQGTSVELKLPKSRLVEIEK